MYHGFRMGSNGFEGSEFFVMRASAKAPGVFTTGSERVPTGSEAAHFSRCVLGLGPQAHLPRVPNGFLGSEAMQFSRCVLGPRLHTHVLCLPDTFWLKLHSSLFASQTNFASTMSSESLEFWTSGRNGTLSRKSQATSSASSSEMLEHKDL